MATYRLWPATNGPAAQAQDGDDYTLAVEFYVTQSGCTATQVHMWCTEILTPSDHAARLYSVAAGGGSGTLVSGSSVAFPTPLVAGWNTVTFALPIPLTQGQRYRAAVYFTRNNGYTATAAYWSTGAGASGITNGPLVAPSAAAAEGNDQGSFNAGADGFPSGSFNAGNYWIDVTIDDNAASSVAGVLAGVAPVPAAALTAGAAGTGVFAGQAPVPAAALTGTAQTPPAAPSVTAGRARPVVRGQGVQLDVVATPPGGETIASHSWTIQSGGGSLTGAATATPTWTAPSSGSGLAVIRDTVTASGGGTASADVTVSWHATVVAAENALPGSARAVWDLPQGDAGGWPTLQGFADGFSVDRTDTVSFKVAQSDTAGWSGEVFRLGYYGGDGARSYGTLTPDAGQLAASQSQPAPTDADGTTTKLSADCSGWSTTLTWTPPAWALSGMYVLRLNRVGGQASHAMFVLRDDTRTADLMVMPSDMTWTAYNAFGGMGSGSWLAGNSLYWGTALDQYNADAARVVSYDRPFVNRAAVNVSYGEVRWSTFFTGEYPMIRFLERNGFDVKYYAGLDAAGDPTGEHLIGGAGQGGVGAAMMVGHNEYWSDGMRAGWEAAKAAGVSIFSCSANEVFWRMVGVGANDAEGRPRRFECYKSTIASRGSTGRPEWTGTWRDPDGAGKGGDAPENTLTGTIFVVNGADLRALRVPVAGGYSAQPLWRDTEVADLTSGEWVSPGQVVGFEWDTYGPAGVSTTGANFLADPHPQARYCSNLTASPPSGVLTDAGDQYSAGSATHRLVVHPNGPAGGITFGTGTINWALGLDSANTYQGAFTTDNTSPAIQQATLNMLVDMGAAPATTMSGLSEPEPVTWFSNIAVLDGQAPTPSGALAGSVTASGAVAGSAPSPTSALAGDVTDQGVMAGVAPQPAAQLAGSVTATGAMAGVAPQPSSTLNGTVTDPAALAGQAPSPTAAMAASVTAPGVLAGIAPVPVGGLVADVDSGGGQLAGTAPTPTSAFTASVAAPGVLAGVSALPVATLAAGVSASAVLAGSAPLPTAALAGGSWSPEGVLAATAPAPTGALVGAVTVAGVLAGVAPSPVGALRDAPPALTGWPPLVTGPFTDPVVLVAGPFSDPPFAVSQP